MFVAQDKRFYEKYGRDVQLILVNSGFLVAQMFQAGEIQITANAPASLVSLAATGEKMSFFLGLSNTSPFPWSPQKELDHKPYPTLDGFKIVIKYVAEQNPKTAAIKAERSSMRAG